MFAGRSGNPAHFGFTTVTEPENFQERFWREFLPWFYKNNPDCTEDPANMIVGTDICMPCPWCEEPTLIAYSKDGYEAKTWRLPADWAGVGKVTLARVTGAGSEPAGEAEVVDGAVVLSVGTGEVLAITRAG